MSKGIGKNGEISGTRRDSGNYTHCQKFCPIRRIKSGDCRGDPAGRGTALGECHSPLQRLANKKTSFMATALGAFEVQVQDSVIYVSLQRELIV